MVERGSYIYILRHDQISQPLLEKHSHSRYTKTEGMRARKPQLGTKVGAGNSGHIVLVGCADYKLIYQSSLATSCLQTSWPV